MGATRADFYPFMVGLAFLLPQPIIFSTWFFHLLGKAQLIIGAQCGKGAWALAQQLYSGQGG